MERDNIIIDEYESSRNINWLVDNIIIDEYESSRNINWLVGCVFLGDWVDVSLNSIFEFLPETTR